MNTKLEELSDGFFGLRRSERDDSRASKPKVRSERKDPQQSPAAPRIEPSAFPVESAA